MSRALQSSGLHVPNSGGQVPSGRRQASVSKQAVTSVPEAHAVSAALTLCRVCPHEEFVTNLRGRQSHSALEDPPRSPSWCACVAPVVRDQRAPARPALPATWAARSGCFIRNTRRAVPPGGGQVLPAGCLSASSPRRLQAGEGAPDPQAQAPSPGAPGFEGCHQEQHAARCLARAGRPRPFLPTGNGGRQEESRALTFPLGAQRI